VIKNCFLFIALVVSTTGIGQTLIMNEVSQGVTGNMEYVEFVVVDNTVTYDCFSTSPPSIDIRGWIFDDNSGYHGSSGIAAGAIRFSFDPLWSAVPLGTIILIYNDAAPDPSIPIADLSLTDGNCKIAAPISNPALFQSNANTPGAIACSYPATGWTAGGTWSNTLLANGGDCARIVDLNGCEVFSVCYGTANLNTTIYFLNGADPSATDHRNTVYYFSDGDPDLQVNWSIGCTDNELALDANQCGSNMQTPGMPNNAANAAYIAQFNNGCVPITPVALTAVTDNNEICGCDGQATASGSGSIGPYTYEWFNSSMTPIGQTAATATGLCDGDYYVQVTSSIGCQEMVMISIANGFTLPTASISGGGTYCAGASVNNIEVAVTGSGGWTVNWTLDGVTQPPATGSTSPISLGNAEGVYLINSVSDVNCSNAASGTQTITVNPLPTVTALTGGSAYCAGVTPSNVIADVTGTPGWTLTYTLNGGTPQTLNGNSSPLTLGNTPGVYVVTAIQDANCSNTAVGTQTIAVNPLPTVTSVTGGGTYCAGSPVENVTASVTGTSSWTVSYTVNGGATQTASGASSPVILGNAPGIYVITAVQDANCSNTASGNQTITVNPLPTVTMLNGGASYCVGESINNITADVAGSPNWTVTYTLNGGAPQTATGTVSPVVLGNSPGVYVVTAVQDANCSNTATGTQTITINSLPTVTSVLGGGTYCAGSLIGDVTATATGSAPWTISYTVDGGAPQTVSSSSSQLVLGNADGVYVVTAIQDANCSNSASGTQTIIVHPLPGATISGGDTYCEGDPINDVMVSMTGSPDWTLSYTLDGVAMTATGTISPISLGNTEGVYGLTGIMDANCTTSLTGSQTITINPIPGAPVAGTNATYCSVWTIEPLTVTGAGGTYTWYNEAGSVVGIGSTFTPSGAIGSNTFYVTETIAGCESPTDEVTIIVNQCDITVPTAFTPDGDGVNDQWQIVDLDAVYPDNVVTIYNRWGNLLFRHSSSSDGPYDQNRWDGTYNEEWLPVGSYYYIIDLGVEGEEAKTGTVTILRKD